MATSTLPLSGEMALFDYLQGLATGKAPNPNYTGVNISAPKPVKELSGEGLQSIITEYMRGQGNFLGNMAQARQSGLYNSNTQKLVADNILTEASRKAALANTAIQESNARIQNEHNRNLLAMQPRYLNTQNQRKSAAGGLAIAGLEKLLGFGTSNVGKAATGAAAKYIQQLFGDQGGEGMSEEERMRLLKKGFDADEGEFTPAPGAFPLHSILNEVSQMSTPLGFASSQFMPSFESNGGMNFADYGSVDSSFLPGFNFDSPTSGGGGGLDFSDFDMPSFDFSFPTFDFGGGNTGGGDDGGLDLGGIFDVIF